MYSPNFAKKGGGGIFNINIPERIYNSEISGSELLVYAYINMKCSLYREDIYVSYDEISYYTKISRRNVKAVVEDLNNKNIIIYNGGVVNINSVIKQSSEKFVQVPFNYMVKIGTTNLLLYFCKLMSTRDFTLKVGFQKLEYIASVCNISERTVIRYNEELEKLGVIYIRRASTPIKRDDGSFYYKNNVYGLASDRVDVDKYAEEHNYGNENKDMGANWQRMVTAKYNAYCKAPDFYKGDIEELINMCEEYNKLMDELQSKQPGNDYIKKKKDMDIFLF